MIDDTSLFGVASVKKDAKNRIMLPSSISAEKGEKLVLMRYNEYFKIISKELLEILLDKLEEEITAALNSGDANVENLKKARDRFFFNALKVMSVDGQSRINIGNDVYENETILKVVGCRDGIYLMTQADYDNVIKEEAPVF